MPQQYSTQEIMLLISKLPSLSQKKAPTLPQSTIAGFLSQTRNRFCLLDAIIDGARVKGYRPDPEVDWRSTNSHRRRVLTLDASRDGFRASLNLALGGGETFPVTTTLGGLGVGALSGGAGAFYSVAALLIELSRSVQPTRARTGDEVWHVEQLAKQGHDVFHVENFVLRDPFRAREGAAQAHEWIIHQSLRKIDWSLV